ncbi:NAD(P)-dependent oxidoreductase [Clostridiaceae bacterium Marseille-Q4143]|nr:NAD(P)-dependent oxidoreductase [Clostridiaceae bacterium Marseille-Q4143]
MKRAVISGATGAIGTALIYELISQNVEILVLCRKESSRNDRIPEHPLVKKCFCSLEELASLENNTEKTYDVFYHFAWTGTIGSGRNDMYLQNLNVKYALDAVDVAARFGCHTFIGAGSQAEYGRVEGLLKAETPAFPENGYGIAKLCAGFMTREYAHSKGLKHIWTRILSVYGPYDGMKTMVMSVLSSIANGEAPRCTKGEQKWDYLYSKDAALAFRLLGEKGVDGKTYVIGSGKICTLSSYINKMCELTGTGIQAELGAIPYAPRQVMYLGADISELANDTGFAPKYSFEEGMKETIRWFRENN